MTPVILSAAQARERQRHATGEVAHCLCPLDDACQGCGGESVVAPCTHDQPCMCRYKTAGWVVKS